MTQPMQTLPIDQCQTGADFIRTIFKEGVNVLPQLYSDNDLQIKCKTELSKLPRFKEQCDPEGYIVFIGLERSQWDDDPDIYLCMYLWDNDNSHGDWWRGSTSTDYGRGNNADKRKIDSTLAQLAKIGWTGGENWGQLAQTYLNKKVPFWVAERTSKKDETKKYYTIAALGKSSVTVAACVAMPGFTLNGAPATPAQAPAPAQQYQQVPTQQYQQAAPAQAAPQYSQYQQVAPAQVAPAQAAPQQQNFSIPQYQQVAPQTPQQTFNPAQYQQSSPANPFM